MTTLVRRRCRPVCIHARTLRQQGTRCSIAWIAFMLAPVWFRHGVESCTRRSAEAPCRRERWLSRRSSCNGSCDAPPLVRGSADRHRTGTGRVRPPRVAPQDEEGTTTLHLVLDHVRRLWCGSDFYASCSAQEHSRTHPSASMDCWRRWSALPHRSTRFGIPSWWWPGVYTKRVRVSGSPRAN